jgi:hypothetical protein
MSGGGGSSTISTSEPRLGALRVQQSTYGLALPIVYGRTRVSGNLVWYGDFVAIAHTTTTSSGGGGGGKGGGGGGVTQSSTTYTYEAALVMALCEGQIGGVNTVWVSKQIYASNPLGELGLGLASGASGQSPWGHLTTNHPDQAIGYSGTSYVYGANYSLTTNAEIANHSFEIDAKFQYGSGIYDANPKDIVYDFLTNSQYGANFPVSRLADMTTYSSYCRAMGLFISPALTEQQEARTHLSDLSQLTNSAFIWSEGKLKIIPYGDEVISGNGATFTPNLTPIYDLTDDDFIVSGSEEDPVQCDRKTPADAFNQIQVEYLNRANAYNVEISEVKDQANIEKYGLRPQDPIKMHGICEANTAKTVAQLVLQRTLYVRNEYEFKLGWKFALLDPMDLVTLTDSGIGLNKTPVRVISIEEDEDGLLTVRAEDYPFGVSSATLYPSQASAGYATNYSSTPGNVSTPSFFEPPVSLTTTGLEVWCAVSGQSTQWGGCKVWASMDGNTYKQVGTVYGGARYGSLSSTMSTSAPVSLAGLGGQLFSGTAQDAALLNTLCWVDGLDGGEFFAYETATLTGANAYTLGGLVRGAYGSTSGNHSAGSRFVRVDQAITKSEPLDLSLIGQQIHFKFTSFNVYGGGAQALADVAAYDYTITGKMLALPPASVTGLSVSIAGNGLRATWDACVEPDYASTAIKIGATWGAGVLLMNKKANSHLFDWQPAGLLKLWAVHTDGYGNQSKAPISSSIVIAAPNQVKLTRTDVQVNTVALGWGDAKSSQPIKSYSIYTGAAGDALSACTLYGKAGSDSRSDVVIFRSAGYKRIYLVAEDLAGNLSTPSAIDVNVTLPTNFVLSSEWDENWTGTKTNAYVDDGYLFMPVNATESWDEHFSANGFATIDDQVNAGYPLVFEPSMSTGSYVEEHDVGKVLPSAKISVTAQSITLVGSVLPSILIEWRDGTTSDWFAGSAGVTEIQATQCRYVRVTYSVTSVGGDDLVKVSPPHVVVSSEEKAEYGALILNAEDSAGTLYTCTKSFLDIVSAIATANNSPSIAKINVIVDDSTSVSKVYVQAWDSSNARCGGSVSLQIGGY